MKKILYLGTDPSHYLETSCDEVIHYPLIQIVPKDFNDFKIKHQFQDFHDYSHILLTSKNAVHVFMQALVFYGYDKNLLEKKEMIVIGPSTAKALVFYGIKRYFQPSVFTQEGVMDLLDKLACEEGYFFYPRSSKARPALSCYLKIRQLRHQICDLYDTYDKKENRLPSLEIFDEVVLTSPSIVESFFSTFPTIPPHLKINTIGPITENCLRKFC